MTAKWNCVTSTDPRLFQSPFRAGIRLDAYQLEPLRRALRESRANLLLADDVGLGKTIEAGLVAQELFLRHRARTAIIFSSTANLKRVPTRISGLRLDHVGRNYRQFGTIAPVLREQLFAR